MKSLSIILFLGVIVCAYAERCPSEEELNPCVCETIEDTDDIKITCGDPFEETLNLEDLKHRFKSLDGKKNVLIYLASVNLGAVPTDFFKNIGVKVLHIEPCDLNAPADGYRPLIGLEDSLEVLEIEKSLDEDDDLRKLKLGHLRKLRKFDLDSNGIKQVTNNWFEGGPASLKIINLYRNRIEEVGHRVFADLPNLETLSLLDNKIDLIERNMLPSSADHLYELNLGDNKLSSLPDDIFSDMPALKTVHLHGNEIQKIDRNVWESVWEQLRVIHLYDNPLICDSEMDWIYELPAPHLLTGECAAPEEKKGKRLMDFYDTLNKQ